MTHIDFGFMLSNTPGSVGFELAPFKLAQDYIDVMGGIRSPVFVEFKSMFKEAFVSLRKRADDIVGLVEIMEKDSHLPCFRTTPAPSSKSNGVNTGNASASNDGYPVTTALRERFVLALTETQLDSYVDGLVASSCNNVFTKLYDSFQVIHE